MVATVNWGVRRPLDKVTKLSLSLFSGGDPEGPIPPGQEPGGPESEGEGRERAREGSEDGKPKVGKIGMMSCRVAFCPII